MKVNISNCNANIKDFSGIVEYQMPKEFAREIIKLGSRKENPQDILVRYVNENCGLLGRCVKVITI